MKTKTYIIAILLVGGLSNSHAQDTWTQKTDFGGTAKSGAAGFSIGDKGYIGTGDFNSILIKDFWQYDPSINAWTHLDAESRLPTASRRHAVLKINPRFSNLC